MNVSAPSAISASFICLLGRSGQRTPVEAGANEAVEVGEVVHAVQLCELRPQVLGVDPVAQAGAEYTRALGATGLGPGLGAVVHEGGQPLAEDRPAQALLALGHEQELLGQGEVGV